MKSAVVLGIMSGTSLDGVDYAVCDISRERVTLLALWTRKFPPSLERRIRTTAQGGGTGWDLAQLHHDLGRFYARGATVPRRCPAPQMAGLHGQTIFHHPDPSSPATLQIGEPTYLAAKLGAPVVSNFRAADMAAGGQGAPLATAFHVRIFGRRGQHVCVNNLGGISNVTSIDWRTGRVPGVVAFDTGPANMLIDIAVRHFSGGRKSCDRDGLWAARGRIAEPLLRRWLRHPFFRKAPPKSTGREMFGDSFFQHALAEAQRARLSKFDLVATLTELTARSLVESYGIHLGSFPDVVILSGGGARNPSMVSAIQRSFVSHGASVKLMDSAALGWPLSGLEPAAFAWLAWLRIRGLPGNHPETTGATRPVLCGQLTAP